MLNKLLPVINQLPLFIILLILQVPFTTKAQTAALDFPDKAISSIEKKYSSLNDRLNKQLAKALARSKKQEAKLQKKLQVKDSTAAAQLFTNTQAEYDKLEQQLKNPLQGTRVSNYIPRLDSLQTAGKFLEQSGILDNSKLNEVKQLSGELQKLEGSLHSAEQIEAYLKQRKELLTAQLQKLGMTKELTQLKKQVYYYKQQIEEYKNLFNDQQKLEQKALSLLRELPAFQNFMQKNSYLAQLFPSSSSGSITGTDPTGALAGLQTRASMEALLQERFGASSIPSMDGAEGSIASNPLEQGMQAAQDQLNGLKDKVNQLGGGSSDMNMPEGFQPNQMRTKSFLKRLEPSLIMQSSGNSKWLPSLLDIGASLGFRLNEKSVVGVKATYKLGCGAPLKNIHFSHEGVNLGAFVDIKLKNTWWITGAAEYNYLHGFKSLRELHSNVKLWQQSALLGVSRKIKIGKKTNNAQILYDFLWKQQVPVTGNGWKFRVGVGL